MKLKDGVAHLAWFVHQALGLITFAGAAGLLWRWRSQLSESHGDVGRMLWNMGIFLALACGYGSIPINTILGGWTSIYQLFWCSPGVQGFDPSPCGFPSLSFHSITFFFDPHLRGANVLASWIVLLPSRTWRWKWKFHLVQPSWSGDSRIANDFCETPGFLNPRCWSLGELPF